MNSLHKKLVRTLLGSRGQSLAVVMVVVCGTAVYICMHATHLNLKLTRDTYYTQNRFADFEIMLERAPITALYKIEEIPGVRRVRGRMVQDVNVDIPGIDAPRTGRLVSMPSPRKEVINDVVVLSGRYFEAGALDEVILSARFAAANGLDLGDRIEAVVKSKKYSLRIVGLGLSPEYVYMIRSAQDFIPSMEKFGILWVPEEFAETALDMQEACNSIAGLADSEDQLDEILDRAGKILAPYGVFAKVKRENQISNRYISDEIKGLGVSATIIPTLFLGIAALILLVVLNRLVQTERPLIGLLKAYGYSNAAVAFHYVEYALALAAFGCLGGFAAGHWLAQGLISLYVEFYQFPLLESRVYPSVLARSMGMALVFAALGALSAAARAARIQPAAAMRPEAPRSARPVLLERIPVLWSSLSFTWKMVFRNMARNKLRSSITVFGCMVSTGLILIGFFGPDSIKFAIAFQFKEVQREDLRLAFQFEHGKDTLYEIQKFDHVRYAEALLEYPFEISAGWRKKEVMVVGIPRDAQLRRLKTFDGGEVEIEGRGLVLSDKLARTLNAGPGSTLALKPLMGRIKKTREVTVRAVSQQFLGTNAYMELEALSRLLDEPFAMNAALLRIDAEGGRELTKKLKDVSGVSSVIFSKDAYQSLLDTLAANLAISNGMILVFAWVISFSIIYNVTSVALAERRRELASLRVLGLTPSEVGRILYYENFLLGIGGIALGVPFGVGMCKLLVKAYDTELYRMPFHIEQRSYAIAVLLVISFVLLANLATRRKLRQLDLVEVLKQQE